jgi:hypothetical protein
MAAARTKTSVIRAPRSRQVRSHLIHHLIERTIDADGDVCAAFAGGSRFNDSLFPDQSFTDTLVVTQQLPDPIRIKLTGTGFMRDITFTP